MILFPKSFSNNNLQKTGNLLTHTTHEFEMKSFKQKIPMKFYVLKQCNDGKLCIDNINYNYTKAEVHSFTVSRTYSQKIIDKPRDLINPTRDTKTPYERVTRPANKPNFSYEEQILPPFRDTSIISDIYNLSDMFPYFDLESIDFNMMDMHQDTQKYYDPDYIPHLFFIDCIYRTLERNKINLFSLRKKLILGSERYVQFIEDIMCKEVLPDIERDRLIVLCYILILMVKKFKVNFDEFPAFKCDEGKILQMLKAIGCVRGKNKIVKLKSAPIKKATQTRRGNKR